jgi:hypothetical protein
MTKPLSSKEMIIIDRHILKGKQMEKKSLKKIAELTGDNYERLRKERWRARQREKIEGIEPVEDDAMPKNARVLVCGCTHAPFTKVGYVEFLIKVWKEYKCDTFVHCGDERDYHTLSRWLKETCALGTIEECAKADDSMKEFYNAFRNAYVCNSNHGSRPMKMGASVGIPESFFKSIRDINKAPEGWKWSDSWTIDGVTYLHGEGFSGDNPQITAIRLKHTNMVMAHIHHVAGIQFSASEDKLYWTMNVGTGVDDKAYAFNYGKHHHKKPVISCGVVINGTQPHIIPMPLGDKVVRIK